MQIQPNILDQVYEINFTVRISYLHANIIVYMMIKTSMQQDELHKIHINRGSEEKLTYVTVDTV